MSRIQALMWAFLVLVVPLSSVNANEQKEYTIGIVPQFETKRLLEIWSPIIERLEKDHKIKLALKLPKDIPSFEKALFSGEYDIAYMNPYHFIVANQEQGYLPLVRDTSRKLYGIMVVRADSAVKDISELDNAKIAYPAPNALGASLMPRALMATKYKLNTTPVYVKSHDSVYLNVLSGLVGAGGGVQKTFNRQPDYIKSQLRIIYKTPKVAPHPIAIHPRVGKEVSKKIETAIFQISPKLMQRIPIKKIGLAKIEDYLPLQDMNLDQFFVKG